MMKDETRNTEASTDKVHSARPALLDCPFCGGKAGYLDHQIQRIFCCECYAEVPGRGLHHDNANEAWNRRVNDSAILNEWANMMENMNIGGTLDLAIKLTRGEARKRAI